MKKLLLSLGAVAAVAAPVAAVVACGSNDSVKTVDSFVTEGTLEFRADPAVGDTHIATADETARIETELAKLTYVGQGKHKVDKDERYYFTGTSTYLAGLSDQASAETPAVNKISFGFDTTGKNVTFFLEKYEFQDDATGWAEATGTTKVAYTLQAVVGDSTKSVLAWIK